MPTSTIITYAEQGAQYWYDAVHGIIFESGGYIAIVVILILIGVLTVGIKLLKKIFRMI